MLDFDFTFNFVPFDLTNNYKTIEDEYKWGWFGIDTLRDYVKTGTIPASEFKRITGEDYEAQAINSENNTTAK